jgi:hypothetical protein
VQRFLDRERVPGDGPPAMRAVRKYHVVHLQRWPLGTPYTAAVGDVQAMLQRPELRGRTQLVIDRTGVGRAVYDLFTAVGVKPIGITITGGESAGAADGGGWNVPKKDLAGVLQATLGTGRLRFAADLPDGEVLRQELQNFEVRVNPAGHASYAADWRTGTHDDVVLALACALWWAEYDATRPRLPRRSTTVQWTAY